MNFKLSELLRATECSETNSICSAKNIFEEESFLKNTVRDGLQQGSDESIQHNLHDSFQSTLKDLLKSGKKAIRIPARSVIQVAKSSRKHAVRGSEAKVKSTKPSFRVRKRKRENQSSVIPTQLLTKRHTLTTKSLDESVNEMDQVIEKKMDIDKIIIPKLSKHNDAAYYPNIHCVLCNEWVCSRNRLTHVESHLQYRPYCCSICGYDNRKEIFISLHISKVHKGNGEVLFHPNNELEKHAWEVAEKSLVHTKEILREAQRIRNENEIPVGLRIEQSENVCGSYLSDRDDHLNMDISKCSRRFPAKQNQKQVKLPSEVFHRELEMENYPSDSIGDVELGRANSEENIKNLHEKFLFKYAIKRSTKKPVIKSSNGKETSSSGTKAINRDINCQICQTSMLNGGLAPEEHVRLHLSKPSYKCRDESCGLTHLSRYFISRHMRSVHKDIQTPIDLIDYDSDLLNEFHAISKLCFGERYTTLRSTSSLSVAEMNEEEEKQNIRNLDQSCKTESVYKVASRAFSVLSHLLESPVKNRDKQDSTNSGKNIVKESKSCDDSLLESFFPKAPSPSLSFKSAAELFKKSTIRTPQPGRICTFCEKSYHDIYEVLYKHAKQHLNVQPYECLECATSSVDIEELEKHMIMMHSKKINMLNRMDSSLLRQSCLLLKACFPGIQLQPHLHDAVCKEHSLNNIQNAL